MRTFAFLILLAPCLAHGGDVSSSHVARARFTTDATNEVVNRVACRLEAHTDIAGQSRSIDVHETSFGHPHRCAALGADAFPVQLQTYGHDVVLEADVNGLAPEAVAEIEEILRGLASEIQKRAEIDGVIAIPKTEAFSPALTAIGIGLGVLGVAMLIGGYGWLATVAANVSTSANANVAPLAFMAGGGASLLAGAGLAVAGEHRVPVRAASIAPFVAPRVGGATAGVTFTF